MKVGATLYLGKGMIRAPGRGSSKQWAVYLQRARIGDDITCRGGFHSCGVFDISNAQIGGSLDLCGATMKPTRGGKLSFIAGRAHIGGNVKCTDWFTCAGVMGLVNAKIDGWLEIDEKSDRHEALVASGLHVGRHASLETTGWIDLRGAEFAGDLTIKLTKLSASGHEPTADLSALSAHVLKLDGRQQGCLDLTRASVQLLLDSPAEWRQNERLPAWIPLRLVKHIRFLKHRLDSQESAANESPVVLDGLVYEQIGSVGTVENPSDRLDWLAAGTQWLRDASDTEIAGGEMRRPYYRARFTPQPYQQLTAVYRRNGRDSDARDVLHTMYCRHNSVMNRSRYVIRAWNSIQNWAIGYGYRPKRAFLWIVLLATSTTVWFALFDNKAKMGPVQAAIASLGLALPGSGLEKVEHFPEMSVAGHLFALGLVLAGLVLGATVIAAIGRAINN